MIFKMRKFPLVIRNKNKSKTSVFVALCQLVVERANGKMKFHGFNDPFGFAVIQCQNERNCQKVSEGKRSLTLALRNFPSNTNSLTRIFIKVCTWFLMRKTRVNSIFSDSFVYEIAETEIFSLIEKEKKKKPTTTTNYSFALKQMKEIKSFKVKCSILALYIAEMRVRRHTYTIIWLVWSFQK